MHAQVYEMRAIESSEIAKIFICLLMDREFII